jgi:hypothetical protein
MKLITGNMWDIKADLYLATTNVVLNRNNELIMGVGSALEMKKRYPESPRLFGSVISNVGTQYGLIILEQINIGAFQTKYHYRNNSDIELIELATNKLIQWCGEHPNKTVSMPFPGIGYGGLSVDTVLPIISTLPDNVTVCRM